MKFNIKDYYLIKNINGVVAKEAMIHKRDSLKRPCGYLLVDSEQTLACLVFVFV
jgi:hypothetical protein